LTTTADIWLTAAAEAAFSELQATAPDQADAVSEAINSITAADGRRIDLPGAPAAEPFLAIDTATQMLLLSSTVTRPTANPGNGSSCPS
jgi:hypothetical protein